MSLPAKRDLVDGKTTVDHARGIWLREPVRETTVLAEQYDFAISLLLLEDSAPSFYADPEPDQDSYDRITLMTRRKW